MISLPHNSNETFSANVELNFYTTGRRIELGQLGPGFAILRNSADIDATEGEIETIVDKKVTRWKVRITSPITRDSRRFTFEPIE